jgi:hypothetical protein
MLACQEGAEPAKMCEDDGGGIASFVTGNQRPGMLSQDERLTQEAQQSAAKWSKNSGKAYAEMQPYVKEIANIVDAEPQLLRQVLTGLHNILGDVRDKAAKTSKQVGTLAGSIASSNIATDTRKIFKRMKGSHEPVLPQAKNRQRMQAVDERIQEHLRQEARKHEAERLLLRKRVGDAVAADGSLLFVQQRPPYGHQQLTETTRQQYTQRIKTETETTAVPSNEDLELEIAKLVCDVDPEKTTFKEFYELLSKKFGAIDLASQKGFIKKIGSTKFLQC